MRLVIAAVAAVLLGGAVALTSLGSAHAEPQISFDPRVGVCGEPFVIYGAGFTPGVRFSVALGDSPTSGSAVSLTYPASLAGEDIVDEDGAFALRVTELPLRCEPGLDRELTISASDDGRAGSGRVSYSLLAPGSPIPPATGSAGPASPAASGDAVIAIAALLAALLTTGLARMVSRRPA